MTISSYNAQSSYPPRFSPGISPKNACLAAALHGVRTADVTAPFVFCDLACGQGESVLLYAKCFPHARFIGVDIDANHIERAEMRASALAIENATFLVGDICDLATLDLPECDFVSLTGTISWLPLKLQMSAIANACSLLSDNGVFFLHYMAGPLAALRQSAASTVSLLAPTDCTSDKDRYENALKRFQRLCELGFASFNMMKSDYAGLANAFATNPDYAVHDYLETKATFLSYEDMTDLVEENGVRFVAPADLKWSLYESFLPRQIVRYLKSYGDWRRQQPRLNLFFEAITRLDIFTKATERLDPKAAICEGPAGKILIGAETAAPSRATNQAQNDRLPPQARALDHAINERFGASQTTFSELIREFDDGRAECEDVIANTFHLLVANLLGSAVKYSRDDHDVEFENVSLELFPYSHDLWNYLGQVEDFPIPSEILGDCLSMNMDDKIHLYLALGGDPDKLWLRLTKIPGFTSLQGPDGPVTNGEQLAKVMAPTIQQFKVKRFSKLARYGVLRV